MKRQQFNNYWKMNKGAGTALESVTAQKQQEVSVTLPHDAMILNKRQKDLPYGNCVGYFPYETVHYTKTFQLGKANCVYLEFEGVYKLLCDCQIDTAEELFAFRENVDVQIEELKAQREHIRNKIRRAPESEKPELKQQAKAVTQKMDPLRRQQRIAKRIAERTPQMQNLLALERLQETQFTRARNERSYTR